MMPMAESTKQNKINVFIIGARGYCANYGGWESFLHGLIDNWKDPDVVFYVFEIVENKTEEGIARVNNANCIRVFVRNTGSSTMMYYDAKCTDYAVRYITENGLSNPILLYLGMRIAPLVWMIKPYIKRKGIRIIENPDGMEWKRTKWNRLVQVYLYLSSQLMARAADYLICDSARIKEHYDRFTAIKDIPKEFIPYGVYPGERVADPMPRRVRHFFDEWKIEPDGYYLILGRYIPENNYEMMLKGFMASNSARKLVVVTNYKEEIQSFHQHIRERTRFETDRRIVMTGSLYDREILPYLRRHAHGYIHGHKVGGTNPGLLEAMSMTNLNILFDGEFNREIGADAAVYFSTAEELKDRIEEADSFSEEVLRQFGNAAKERMRKHYSWGEMVEKYDRVFHRIVRQYPKGPEV